MRLIEGRTKIKLSDTLVIIIDRTRHGADLHVVGQHIRKDDVEEQPVKRVPRFKGKRRKEN